MGIDNLLSKLNTPAKPAKAPAKTETYNHTPAAPGAVAKTATPASTAESAFDFIASKVEAAKQGMEKLTGASSAWRDVGIHNSKPEVTREALKQHYQQTRSSADPATMKDGDKTTLSGSVSTPAGGVSQNVEFRKEKGKFIVTVGGGNQLGVDGAVSVGGSGKQEFTFKTAAEAERGLAIIGKMQSGGARLGDKSIGGASPEDLEWLQKRATATQVTFTGEAGTGTEAEKIALGAGAASETSVRVEYDKNGNASVSVRSKVQASGSVSAPFGSFNNEASESLEIEQSYDLPPNFDLSRLKDPATAKAALAELAAKGKAKPMKLRYGSERSATTFGNGIGSEKKTEVEVSPEQARRVAQAWRKQGAAGAAKELGNTPVTVTERTYVQGGVAAGVSVSGAGGKVGATSQRTESIETRRTTANREAGEDLSAQERDRADDVAFKSEGPHDPLAPVDTEDPLARLETKDEE